MRPADDHYRGSSGSGIKKEGGGYVSSEEEEEDVHQLPKQDIDMIDLTRAGSQSPESTEKKQQVEAKQGLLPVRIVRREHQERVVGINTEASSSSARKLKEEPGKDGDASTQKGKMKGKDFEITEVRRPYKGMWQDSSDDDVQIKPEPDEDAEGWGTVPQASQEHDAGMSTKGPQASSPVPRKPKRQPARGIIQKPALQTEQEKEEWERYERSLQLIRYELGSKPRSLKADVQDEHGDAVMKDAEAEEGADFARLRDEHVYLFQLPPILPDLLPPDVKSEPTGEENSPHVEANNGEETVIKLEEDAVAAPEPLRAGPRLSSGRIGKMRVHASGRTTLNWGGMMFEVRRGIPAQFYQETVCTRITPEKDRVNEDDGGTSTSFGPVKGKYVLTPDWSELLG
jgi:DNA-directed RNA polymerase III subunit RPC4